MKKFCRFFRCTRCELHRIHLVDKCLILFMIVLLAQSAFSLFFQGNSTNGMEHIDVIVRTSTAAIFGYFLSGNFIRRSSSKEEQTNSLQAMESGNASAPSKLSSPKPRSEYSADRLQIIIATAIGLFCLIVLIIQKDFAKSGDMFINSATGSATVAQFRDFISGCVGFLIGSPTEHTPKSGS